MITHPIKANIKISFANYLMASYRNSYSKLWVQAASVFTMTFMVFCLSMLLAGAFNFFSSPIFTTGAALSLTGLYLPVVLLVKYRINFTRNKGL